MRSCVPVRVSAWFFVVALLVAGTSAQAEPQRFRAGFTRITVQDVVPFVALIAYPTDAAEVAFQVGPFTMVGSRDAPIASGPRGCSFLTWRRGNDQSGG